MRQSIKKRMWWDKRRQEWQPGSNGPIWMEPEGMGRPGHHSPLVSSSSSQAQLLFTSTSTCRSFSSKVLKTKFLSSHLFTTPVKRSVYSPSDLAWSQLQKLKLFMDQLCARVSSRWQQSPQSSEPRTKDYWLPKDAINVSLSFCFFPFGGRQFLVAQTSYVAEIEHFLVYSLTIFVYVCA